MSSDLVNDAAVDVDGFVQDWEVWSEELALELAAMAGVKRFTDEHWAIIKALRAGYKAGDPDFLPQNRGVCASTDMQEDCVSRLFGDPLVAWRIVGLPKPAGDMQAFAPISDMV